MHLATLLTALLLPLAAVAEDLSTTTSTSTKTLTQTITIQRAAMVTAASNLTTTRTLPSTTLTPPGSTTGPADAIVTNDKNAGSSLGAAHVAAVAVAGVMVAALL